MPQGLKILFAGTPEFAAVTLNALLDAGYEIVAVYTQPDRPAGRGRKLTASSVKALALEHHLPVVQPVSLRVEEAQQELAAWGADLMVVAAYGLILPQAVLDTPHLGCVNVHASLLPRWRGAAPIQRAILAGDAETGITIMQMDAGLDTGDMLHLAPCPISDDDTAQTLHDKLASLGAQALVETLPALVAGTCTPQVQDAGCATYAEKLQKAEAQLDWQQPAELLARQVRAFNPWPVSFAPLSDGEGKSGQNLRIWMALPLTSSVQATPGEVIAESCEGIDVATVDGTLRVTRLQMPGAKPLSAAEFLNAHSLLGSRLG